MALKPSRKPGAQPGNTNAFKHGFYSPRFLAGELADLQEADPLSLKDEIAMLRVVIRRVMVLAEEGREPGELMNLLDTLGAATMRLANLLKTQKLLGGRRRLDGAQPGVGGSHPGAAP